MPAKLTSLFEVLFFGVQTVKECSDEVAMDIVSHRLGQGCDCGGDELLEFEEGLDLPDQNEVSEICQEQKQQASNKADQKRFTEDFKRKRTAMGQKKEKPSHKLPANNDAPQ